nr:MAG TPA: hypothetical protein [Caudoviricetes sp.]
MDPAEITWHIIERDVEKLEIFTPLIVFESRTSF